MSATLDEGEGAGGYVSWVKGISGGFTIANGVVIDNAIGGAGSDRLIGNAEDNELTGGGGQDILTGGLGPDSFIFMNLTDSAAGAKRDTITDFTPEDTINLLGIDANSRVDGNQDFRWIDGASFTGQAGDLRFRRFALSGVTKVVWQDDLFA